MGNRENRTGIFELNQNPALADLFRIAVRTGMLELSAHTLCTVVAYDPARQRVTVTTDVLRVIKDLLTPPTAVDPNPTTIQPPVQLADIPVAWPKGTLGASYQTFPIVPGDKGELHIQDRSIEAWLAAGIPTDPVASWTHALQDAVFHPSAPSPATAQLPPTDPTAHVLEGPLVKLGALAVSFLAKAPELVAAIDALLLAGVTAEGPGAANFSAATTAWNLAKANIPTTKAMGE